MSDRPSTTDRGYQEEAVGGSYFASLAQASYLLLTTFRRKGAPVSTRVQGIVDGDRACIRVWSRSGAVKHLRHTDVVQVRACNALGLVSYGPSLYAAARLLADEEASRVAGQLACRYPVQRRFLARLLRRTPVHYELLAP